MSEPLLGAQGGAPQDDVQKTIKEFRDTLYNVGGTVFFRSIIKPISAHGAHLIYAPDDKFCSIYKFAKENCCRGGGGGSCCTRDILMKRLKEHWCFCLVVLVCVAGFKMEGEAIKCAMQNFFFGWSTYNRSVSYLPRFLSISVMMCLRMLVSNVLPFTSPAFAFLIAKSQPPDEGWLGTVYLLACSMPAGLIVPIMDKLLFWTCGKKNDDRGEEDLDGHFRFTNSMSWVTDHLPFSFWVRPFFMEPVFVATKAMKVSDESCASAAVLAGHFMIWAGPPTTMYQRQFVPDWITCIFIQPLGLMEDVAVVLATWAGSGPSTQRDAEIGLYIFMLAMNLLRYLATKPENRQEQIRHFVVAVLTGVAIAVKVYMHLDKDIVEQMLAVPTTTAPATPPMCAMEHSNLKVMMYTAAKVTAVAFMARIVSHIVVRICAKLCECAKDDGANTGRRAN